MQERKSIEAFAEIGSLKEYIEDRVGEAEASLSPYEHHEVITAALRHMGGHFAQALDMRALAQRLLHSMGYRPGVIDGLYGFKTRAAEY